MLENKVIVLNADYQFMNIVTSQKAFSYIARGKVVVEKYTNKTLTTCEKLFNIPLVIRFVYLVRKVFGRKVPWSKRNICIRDNYTCAYCGIKDRKMTVDHVVPKAMGGKNSFENTVCACKQCNNKKGDKLPKECGMYPSHKMVQPTISEFMKIWYKQFDVDEIIKSIWE
jgi:5-methylcytosine-specific restriction endonuclease McrA